MKQVFLTLERWTTALALFGACAMLVVSASLGMFQIITRFVLEQPAEWTEVLIRFHQGAMMSMDVLHRWSPPRVRRVLDWVVALAALTLMAIIVWWGWDYSVRGRVQTMAGLESLSMFWAYVAMPVGAVFSAIGIIGNLIDPRRMELETAQ